MVLVPYAGKYFGRKCAYWGESVCLFPVLFCSVLFCLAGHGMLEVERKSMGGADRSVGSNRLGEIHAVEISGRGGLYEQKIFQGGRRC